MDQIDIHLEMARLPFHKLEVGNPSAKFRARMEAARQGDARERAH